MIDEIICRDSFEYFREQNKYSLPSIVTGLPDFSECKFENIEEYKKFIENISFEIFNKVQQNKFIIIQITDRKYKGQWVDKSFHINKAAEKAGIPLRFHKIILLRDVGKICLHRPTYQHYLCYSHQFGPGQVTADVFDGFARENYNNGNTIKGIEHALDFLDKYDKERYILDPFVGRGSILKRAKLREYRVLGIDIDPAMVASTKTLLS